MEVLVQDRRGKEVAYVYDISATMRNHVFCIYPKNKEDQKYFNLIDFYRTVLPYHIILGHCKLMDTNRWISKNLSSPFGSFVWRGEVMKEEYKEYFQLWDNNHHTIFLFSNRNDAMLFRLRY